MRSELDAAFAVPLTDRAVNVETLAELQLEPVAAAAIPRVPAADTPTRKRAKAA